MALDLIWEAFVAECGYTVPVTDTERGRINAAIKELRGIYPESTPYAIAIDIAARAKVYRQKFPGMEVTPQALTGNWSRLDPNDVTEQPHENTYRELDSPPEFCETCHGNKMVLVSRRHSDYDEDGYEEYAPCPDCHPNYMQAGYWRYDGSRFNPPEPNVARKLMLNLLEASIHDQ